MSRWKEVAKFACGSEAFHAFIHAYFWLSGTTLHVSGWFTETPAVHMWGAIGIGNAVIALLLGMYAWGGAGAARPAAGKDGHASLGDPCLSQAAA
ncbi:MAG: hypothetical protein K2W96_24740 [Gemmataceae bacterium]|nr:hypothetical protein [Gemmataceae bacterium]